jgi:hypothetical protein
MWNVILFVWLILGIIFPIFSSKEIGMISMIPIVSLFIFPFILCLIDGIFKSHLSCTIFGWHDGNGSNKHFHEKDVLCVNLKSTCSKCGKEVMQDSQGNWF